jgi:hypothetical protein
VVVLRAPVICPIAAARRLVSLPRNEVMLGDSNWAIKDRKIILDLVLFGVNTL